MRQKCKALGAFPAAAILWLCGGIPLHAGPTDLCVSCADPSQTYICRVDTPGGSPGEKALQLFCIMKTARQGGHSACSVRHQGNAGCEGQVVSHIYDGPVLPAALRERANIPDQPQSLPGQDLGGLPPAPAQRGGEPDTLVEMGGPAVNAGKSAARTMRNAAGNTGETIGHLGKKAGRGASEATRDAGSAVGSAARYTYNCIKSLFRNCSGSSADQ
jgi:hypothetical protein